MSLDPSYFGPYLSFGLLQTSSAKRSVTTLLDEIRTAVLSDRSKSERGKPRVVHRVEKFTEAAVSGCGFVYRTREVPSWWRGTANDNAAGIDGGVPITNDLLHLVLVLKRAESVAVYTSYPSDWGRVLRAVDEKKVTKVIPMPPDRINGAFTKSSWAMPAVWMKGLHHPVLTKPDSKQLTGLDVRSVIDQYGDQTYQFSSGRSRVPVGQDKHELIGLSPSRHRIWLGPSASFSEFRERVEWVLESLSNASAIATPIAELAQPLQSLDQLEVPDEIGWAPQDEESSWSTDTAVAVALLEQLNFDLDTTNSKVTIEDDGTGDRTVLVVVHLLSGGDVVAEVSLKIRYSESKNAVLLRVVPASQSGELTEHEDAIDRILVKKHWVTIRYPGGHVVSGETAYLPHYSARPFTAWEWVDFSTPRGVDVTKEKPMRSGATDRRAVDLARIGNQSDDSLFSWVYDRWGKARAGILLCDDGSGEIADFLHLAPPDGDGESELTFVHAKGGKSQDPSRNLSVTAYEVVIAQATKNLAYAESNVIAEKVRAHSKGSPVWVDGVLGAKATQFADELEARGGRVRRRVVVLQPHTVKNEYEKFNAQGVSQSSRARHMQLSTLLLEAQASCRRVGAEFTVIAAER